MDDLVTRLRLQLDEDERAAREASAGPWRLWHAPMGDRRVPVAVGGQMAGEPPLILVERPEDGAHIARHDSARVLREVESKRRLMEQFELRGNSVRATVVPSTGGVWDDLLRMLALPYADRPGYREEWKP